MARGLRTSRRQPTAPHVARALEAWHGPMAEDLLPPLAEAGRLVGVWADREHAVAAGAGAQVIPDAPGSQGTPGAPGAQSGGASTGPSAPGSPQLTLALFPAEHPARAALRRLGAAARPGDPLFPHALRVAVGTTAAEAAGRALGDFWGHGLPGHGFWAALTTMLVLFPDYGHTFARGWARPLGSILGGLAAWAALLPAWWTPDRLVVAAVVLTACVFLTLRVGQLVLNFFITAWLVVLIARLGKAPDLIAWGRPADTLLGAMIGLLVFLVLPTYHHDRLSSLVAAWTDVQRRLLNVLVGGLTEPGVVRYEDVDALRSRSRHTRERLESAVAALRHEPRGHRARWNATEIEAVQRSIADLSRCASQLYAAQPRRDADAVPEAAEIAALFDTRLTALADALDSGAPIPAATVRASFDESARRGGLTDLTDHRSPDGIAHARARALTLCLRTALAVDTFATGLSLRSPSPG
ncbi:FUSC family protein [Streptomyces sp. RTd22]|uniref:FUSC family protein n=1 Tax=Streptomyces sp. RTd22 TaxID=1841249 RepID=UPI00131AC9B3|nr:FUSC family protein [Streptomyces sp. RTd22]